MGLFNPSGFIKRVTDELSTNIQNTGLARVSTQIGQRIANYLETMSIVERVSVITHPVHIQRFFTGLVNSPQPQDIVIGRWFTTPAPTIFIPTKYLEYYGEFVLYYDERIKVNK